MSSVVKANGTLAFASGEDDGSTRSRFQKKPRSVPFIRPRSQAMPNLPVAVTAWPTSARPLQLCQSLTRMATAPHTLNPRPRDHQRMQASLGKAVFIAHGQPPSLPPRALSQHESSLGLGRPSSAMAFCTRQPGPGPCTT